MRSSTSIAEQTGEQNHNEKRRSADRRVVERHGHNLMLDKIEMIGNTTQLSFSDSFWHVSTRAGSFPREKQMKGAFLLFRRGLDKLSVV